ncbi:hypothetical protein TSUD_267810 [Trifolium subterraneum]|uniref:F-box domain-containing protein n=1 Tax=Trifolium subterraneum TaxID=3900 RepID=A0A2Z6NKT2_TRISU|nr:hypothetical protein TSUD_267810 [Trifolium subterraneum]
MVEAADFYLPHECWVSIITFVSDVDDGENNHGRYLKSLSVVSKQFQIITNRLRSSLNLYNGTGPFLDHLFKRFTNLTSLDFRCFRGDLNELLSQISCFRLNLKSLNLSDQPTIPANGLRAFSKNITTVTSLICSNIGSLQCSDFFLILNCFRLLEELDLSYPLEFQYGDPLCCYICNIVEVFSLALSKIRKFNLSGHYYLHDELIFILFKNWRYLEEAILPDNHQITITGIASALSQRPTLRSLSFSSTSGMTHFKKKITSPFMDALVSLKSLTCLDLKSLNISDELLSTISVEGLPLRKLVLQYCTGYSFVGIFHLLSKCKCIQHLDLQSADFLNDQHVVQLSLLLDNLVSINLNECKMVTKSALCALVRNCTSLSEIKMKRIGSKSVENSNSFIVFGVYP